MKAKGHFGFGSMAPCFTASVIISGTNLARYVRTTIMQPRQVLCSRHQSKMTLFVPCGTSTG